MGAKHCQSEMPYRCETCSYRTSSHKDVIDHYYEVHEDGEALQCPYCLKVIQFIVDGRVSSPNVHAYLLHMQRHILRREQGRGNKCSRCCLWFNQKSSLKNHQDDLHQTSFGTGGFTFINSNFINSSSFFNSANLELLGRRGIIIFFSFERSCFQL